jgi:DNA-binding CsgD family transcriptional regulator/PAS domain-containing protein
MNTQIGLGAAPWKSRLVLACVHTPNCRRPNTAPKNNKRMGQLTSITRQLPADAAAFDAQGEHDLPWLGLLDQLYALVETDGFEPSGLLKDGSHDWPPHWQPLVARWAAHIGARSIRMVEPRRVPPLRHAARLSRVCSLHAQPAGPRPAVSAQSLSADGFTAEQVHKFHAFCSHLGTALALQAELHATWQSLALLYRVVDTLPMGLVMLDEALNVVLLNRQAREWLSRTDKAAIHARRLCLSSEQAAFETALHALAADANTAPQQLQLNGLDIHLKKLTHAAEPTASGVRNGALPFSVLMQIHERCDPARRSELVAPPAVLARLMQHQFTLTDKELALAWNLAQGMCLKQYAALSGRSIETGRAQLKSVFRKLGVTGQSGIGMIVFEALHAVALQSMGTQLATLKGKPTGCSPWR